MSISAPPLPKIGRLLSSVRAIEAPSVPSEHVLRMTLAPGKGGVEYCSGHRLEFVRDHLDGEICECLLHNGRAILVPAAAIKWEPQSWD